MAQFVKLDPTKLTALRQIDERPELQGVPVSGKVTVAPGSCAFIVV